MKRSLTQPRWMALIIGIGFVAPAQTQTAWDSNAVRYKGDSVWQQAAVAALNRHLPADSGYWVLGPINLSADLPDTTDLVATTLRLIAPNPRASRNLVRRLWLPTGGVALEELQPSDTLPHELPPGYMGRFLQGTIVGERVYVQVFTIQEHRWLLWAQRAQIADIRERVVGPLARYSEAVGRYLAAIDSGSVSTHAPTAAQYGLDKGFDLFAEPALPVIRTRQGYLDLLAANASFTLADVVTDVEGFVPGPRLMTLLEELAEDVLFLNKVGDPALQRRFRTFRESLGRWVGYPVLSSRLFSRLQPGRYIYTTDRYGMIRVARVPMDRSSAPGPGMTTAVLAMGEPVQVAGEMLLVRNPGEPLRIAELNIRSEDYFFSNRSLSLYGDVQDRSDRYMRAVGHVLQALETAHVSREGILVRKF